MPPPLPWRKKSRKQNKQAKKEAEKASVPEDASTASSATESTPEAAQPLPSPIVGMILQSQPQTPLIDLVRMQNWDLVRTQGNRRAAKKRDADGLLPLHWAVSGGPPSDVVDTLIKVYPSGAKKLDKEKSSALHFATHYAASTDVIKTVLRAYPQAAGLQDRYGRSPLYHAVDKCVGLEALKLLVQTNPSMATLPCVQEEYRNLPLTRMTATLTPLYIAWAHVVNHRNNAKLRDCKRFEKAQLLMEAAFFHAKNVSPPVPREYHFISGAIAMDMYLPDKVLPMAIEHMPQDLLVEDREGRDALARAAATNQYSKERADTVTRLLLEAHPDSATKRDRKGFSPLQLALLAGKTWSAGVSRLTKADPDAVGWTGNSGNLPAFAAAASLEAEECAAEGTLEETPTEEPWLIRRADPYNLLSSKQRELLVKARKRLEEKQQQDEEIVEGPNPEMERLTTILDLLQADPAALPSTL